MAVSEDLLQTTISLAPSRLTVGVSGELDMYTARGLRDAVSTAMRPDLSLIVDLAEVTFIDSVGLATLLSLAEAVREADGEFHLQGPSARVKQFLEITGLTEALPTTESAA
jgi:anti-sigma B factor antagonist